MLVGSSWLAETGKGKVTKTCPTCLGKGVLYVFVYGHAGPGHIWDKCHECKGKGRVKSGKRELY
jgi:DnaJ-class molecular chaperone